MKVAPWPYRNTVLAATVLAFFGTMVARISISPVVPDIIDAFGISKSVIGLGLTGMWAMYAVFQFPGGVLGDRFGERRLILTALGLTAVGSFLIAVAPSFVLFGLAVLFLGAGAGLYFSPASSLLTGLFENTARALGFHSTGGYSAGLVTPIVVAYIATNYHWRLGLLSGSVVAAAAFTIVAWRVDPTPPENPDRPLSALLRVENLSGILRRPPVIYTSILAVTGYFTWQAFTSFFPTFLIEYWGYSAQYAGTLFGVVFLLATIGLPIVGSLGDAFTSDWVIAASFLCGASGFAVFLARPPDVAVVPGVLLIGIGLSWAGVVSARFMTQFAADERGTGFGLVRTIFLLLGSLGSVVTGVLADAFGWTAAYGLVIALIGATLALIATNRALQLGW